MTTPTICASARHRTAISRAEFSRPIRLALRDELLGVGARLFDYGCGRGDDLRLLDSLGIEGDGWDPTHRPTAPLRAAPIVNLGYVVNVVEDTAERDEVLRKAWTLAERVLIVSARLASEARAFAAATAYADGWLTGAGTFQRLYEQDELKRWIDATLEVTAVPAGPGVFYIFRDENARTRFLASRYRRRALVPRLSQAERLFAANQDLIQPLIEFLASRGRMPADDELPAAAQITSTFGSLKRARAAIERSTGEQFWAAVREQRSQDLLIYLALARFDVRPPFSRLPRDLQIDVKSFFSSYAEACSRADTLLFSLGNSEMVDAACRASPTGKLLPSALYVHESAVEQLSPTLRVFEGCARGYIGRVDGANIIKLNRWEPKVAYLAYPSFLDDPHPALAWSVGVNLRTFQVKFRGFETYRSPPVLHRKETFLAKDHP
ncbi:MAG: DNA phosphorothioation-associated putative methyltransferase [Geminicoccaceae bacterium]